MGKQVFTQCTCYQSTDQHSHICFLFFFLLVNTQIKDGRAGRWMHRWINLGPFKFLAAFPFQVRIAIYYPNYKVIRPPTKMLTWPALIFSMYLTTDLKTFILSKYHEPFSGCLFTFMLFLCADCVFLYFIIYITVVMLLVTTFFSEVVEEADVTLI